ncbi:MAG: hypothetical protein HKN05_21970 [Rhizobiales bacterium]|nr:hypothetical protein [Hyphomicrobiales bacterium]
MLWLKIAKTAAPVHVRAPGFGQDDALGDFWTQAGENFAARLVLNCRSEAVYVGAGISFLHDTRPEPAGFGGHVGAGAG